MEHKNIHEAIAAVMGEVGYVKKERNARLDYTFAGEAALIAALRPAMVEHGIYCHVLEMRDVQREVYTTKGGTPMVNIRLIAIVRFAHAPSGTWVDTQAVGEGSDAGDKSANKAMTGAYKYALRQTFCIETGDDPDKEGSEERAGKTDGKAEPSPSEVPLCHECRRPGVKKQVSDRPNKEGNVSPNAGKWFYRCEKCKDAKNPQFNLFIMWEDDWLTLLKDEKQEEPAATSEAPTDDKFPLCKTCGAALIKDASGQLTCVVCEGKQKEGKLL
jgi:hypothetical protein